MALRRIVLLTPLTVILMAGGPRWWKKATPKGEVLTCEVARSYESMISALKRAGWDTATIPTVDWGVNMR